MSYYPTNGLKNNNKKQNANKNNKNRMVAFNRKQKKLWLVQNKLKKLIEEK